MSNVNDITTEHWSLSIDEQGKIVTDLDDISQCIYIILTTDRGSDPLRPEFGTNIYRLVDKPLNNSVPNMIKEIADSIEIWETRAELVKVSYKFGESNITFIVEWQPTGSVLDSIQKTEITYDI